MAGGQDYENAESNGWAGNKTRARLKGTFKGHV